MADASTHQARFKSDILFTLSTNPTQKAQPIYNSDVTVILC